MRSAALSGPSYRHDPSSRAEAAEPERDEKVRKSLLLVDQRLFSRGGRAHVDLGRGP